MAVNEEPLIGGLCIIQAKRSKNAVPAEAVRALAGVMHDKAAAKGIVVTTAWFGKASWDFAHRTGRMELIDGRHLKALLFEHLGIDALIGLPKLPPAGRHATSPDTNCSRYTRATSASSDARKQSSTWQSGYRFLPDLPSTDWAGVHPGSTHRPVWADARVYGCPDWSGGDQPGQSIGVRRAVASRRRAPWGFSRTIFPMGYR
ncbi:restriction endonuclease [Streptomyces sp. NBC_01602]|uniref:restriction endonuclease n=1 Tax=Streptomyces sp. NBC_01602 TaxID=2975893 RepID=UPI003866077D